MYLKCVRVRACVRARMRVAYVCVEILLDIKIQPDNIRLFS